MKSLPTSSGWMALATRTFLSQSSTKIYVSFHTHGPCFCLNCAKSLVFDRVLAASLTLATTSSAVAFSCPTATLDRTTMSRATARATRILPLFIRVLPQPRFPFLTSKTVSIVRRIACVKRSRGTVRYCCVRTAHGGRSRGTHGDADYLRVTSAAAKKQSKDDQYSG